MKKLKIIDSHVHFPAIDFMGNGKKTHPAQHHPWLEKERNKWKQAWNFGNEQPVIDEEKAVEDWYCQALKHNLDRVVFVTAGGNLLAQKIVEKHPDKFIAYAHNDPSIKGAQTELERALKYGGLKGYKILGPAVETPLNDKSLYPVWEVAQSYDVPVLIHFGIMGGAGGTAYHVNINPLIIHDVAKAFPNMKIIIPHFGCGYVFETLNLCWACPNVFIDTSGSNQWMRWMPYEVSLESLFRKYRETIGPERIIFGTDSSWFPRGFTSAYLDEQLRAMIYTGFSSDDIDKVLYDNIAQLLRIR